MIREIRFLIVVRLLEVILWVTPKPKDGLDEIPIGILRGIIQMASALREAR